MSYVNACYGLINYEPYTRESEGERWSCDLCGNDFDELKKTPRKLNNPDNNAALGVCEHCLDDEMRKLFSEEEKGFLGALAVAFASGLIPIAEHDSEVESRYSTWMILRGVK
jgi:hypothetical protein